VPHCAVERRGHEGVRLSNTKHEPTAFSRNAEQTVNLDALKLDAHNANMGTRRGAQALDASLKDYGAGRSILLDRKGQVIAGNKTLEAAKRAGYKRVVVVPSDGKTLIAVQRDDLDLDSSKGRALAVADNRAGELGLNWDNEVLAEIAKQNDLSAFFNPVELRDLLGDDALGDAPEPQLDRADELQAQWKTATGQMWEIGRHRLLCGDSTKQSATLLSDRKAAMCFTDPPWNVAIGGDGNPRHRQRKGLQNDSMKQADFDSFLVSIGATIAASCSGDVYCVMGCEQWPAIDEAMRAAGMHWSATVIWAKDIFVLGRSKYHRRYEPIWYGWPSKGKSSFCGLRNLDDVWEIPRPRTSEQHPTMKPVELVARAVRNSSEKRDSVFDPFLGSGTTMVAAEQTQRICYGIEIDPRFVAVTLQRMQDMGLKPKLGES
jgi:DNA modification methylase